MGAIRPHVFPTRVGVDLQFQEAASMRERFPHTRGGGPPWMPVILSCHGFSPHAWGWTANSYREVTEKVVFPTRVGVDRPVEVAELARNSFPHTRGGGPMERLNR